MTNRVKTHARPVIKMSVQNNMKHIRVTMIIYILLVSASLSYGATANHNEKIDWVALKSAFQTYADYPTDSNADKVIALLPKHSHAKYTGGTEEKKALDYIYDYYQLNMLERQVLSGDREAVRLAFNLMSIADGAFAEDLDIMLGATIRTNPSLFLEGLYEYQDIINRLDGLVGNEGPPYVDRLKAQCYESQLRIDALLRVKDPKLKHLRDKCIMTLKEQIKSYCNGV